MVCVLATLKVKEDKTEDFEKIFKNQEELKYNISCKLRIKIKITIRLKFFKNL